MSCSKSEEQPPQATPTVKDIYIGGRKLNGTKSVAKIWKMVYQLS